jgi:hypothetical protein
MEWHFFTTFSFSVFQSFNLSYCMFQKEDKSFWKTVEIYDKNKTCKSLNFIAFPYTPSLLLYSLSLLILPLSSYTPSLLLYFWSYIYYIYFLLFYSIYLLHFSLKYNAERIYVYKRNIRKCLKKTGKIFASLHTHTHVTTQFESFCMIFQTSWKRCHQVVGF